MSARLIDRTGDTAPTDFVIADDALLGTATDNDIRLTVEGVSRKHARIWREGEAYYLEDAGSTNGTFVNGQRVETVRLHHLDVVSLARYVDLIFLEGEGKSRVVHGQALKEASIEWIDGPEAGTVGEISLGETTIGRDWSSNVAIDVPVVSKLHVRLVRHGDFLTIRDLGSTNGTTVDGRELDGVLTLQGGEEVCLGGGVRFRVQLLRDPAVPASAPIRAPASDDEVFDQEWRTRLIWSPEELAEIESARARIRAGSGEPAGVKDTEVVDEEGLAEELDRAADAERTVLANPELLDAAAERAGARDQDATQAGGIEPVADAAPNEVLEAAGLARSGTAGEASEGGDKTQAGPAPGEADLPAQVEAAARSARGDDESSSAGAGLAIRGVRLEGEQGAFRLDAGESLIGRDLTADVWLDGEGVSRKHALLYVSGHSIEIEDLGSSNGTVLNGEKVTRRTPMKDGDRLELGGVELRLEVMKD